MSWEVSTMLSKKSYFNATLFRKNLSRFWPLWGGVSLLGSVFPLYLLLQLLNLRGLEATASDITISLYHVTAYFVPGFLLVYASLCGVLVWSYLNSARSVGLYHALPVDRTCLFLTSAVSGLAMVLLPFAIVGLFFVLVTLCFGILSFQALATTVVAVLGMALLYFASFTLVAMITGSSFAALVFYYLGHFLAVLLQELVFSFARGFLFGVEQASLPWVTFFSPTAYLYENLRCVPVYTESSSGGWEVLDWRFEGLGTIGIYALIALVILAVSLLLYRRRSSECAGDVIAQRWLRPVFRYGVALFFGLTLGQLLYSLVYGLPFQRGLYNHMLPMAVCVILTSIIGYYVASMLLKKSLRVFRRSWRGPLTVAAIVVILCGCVSFDLFGLTAYVPAQEDVVSVSIRSGATGSITISGESAAAAQVLRVHQAILDDEAYIRESTADIDSFYSYSSILGSDVTYLDITYTLRGGRQVARSYTLPLILDRWQNQPDTYDYQLRELAMSPELQTLALMPGDGGALMGGYFYYYDLVNDVYEDSPIEATASHLDRLYEAVLADAAEGRCPLIPLPFDSATEYMDMSLEFTFRVPEGDTPGQRTEWVQVELNSGMTHTLDTLVELGYLRQDVLDTIQRAAALQEGAAEALSAQTA